MTGEEHKRKIWATIIIFYSSDSKSVDFCKRTVPMCSWEILHWGCTFLSSSPWFLVLIKYRFFIFDICKDRKSSVSGVLSFYWCCTSDLGMVLNSRKFIKFLIEENFQSFRGDTNLCSFHFHTISLKGVGNSSLGSVLLVVSALV